MARRARTEDEWDDDEEEFDSGEEDEESTVPCPYCRRQILEDTPRCPYCENYISEDDTPPAVKPRWIIVGFLACMLVVILWLMNR
jgi:hypothetical protein